MNYHYDEEIGRQTNFATMLKKILSLLRETEKRYLGSDHKKDNYKPSRDFLMGITINGLPIIFQLAPRY